MACKGLNIQAGLFIPTNWSQNQNSNLGGVSVTLTTGGNNPNITYQGPNGQDFIQQGPNDVLRYILWGSGYLLILKSQNIAGQSTHFISLADFTTPALQTHLLAQVNSDTQHPLPGVQVSQGTGDAFILFVSTPFGVDAIQLDRSDTGGTLCFVNSGYMVQVQLVGNANANQVLIQDGGQVLASANIPKGSLQVQGSPLNFPDAIIGGCPQGPIDKTVTLRNNGTDCLSVTAIGSVAPYSFVGANPGLPANLSPNGTTVATIRFQPGAIGTFNNVNLAITRNPAAGDDHITCSGKARAPVAALGFSSKNISFGTRPVGSQSPPQNLVITNTGEIAINISVAAPLAGSAFQWAATNQNLTCGQAATIPITFTPTQLGPNTAALTVTSNAPSNPDTVNLSGNGCIAAPQIAVPNAFPAYGNVEQGYRLVRLIHVANGGNGTLTFNASIGGPDAALFELLPSPSDLGQGIHSHNYSVDPVTPCGGAAGTGDVIVAVAFFANGMPAQVANATLTIGNHNVPAAPSQFVLPLTATIAAATPVDAVAVIDRSGSMNDAVPGGTKADAALTAARLFLQLLPQTQDHRFGAVRFNEQPDPFLPIAPLNAGSVQGMMNALTAANLAPQGWTCIAGGAAIGIQQDATPRNPPPAVPPRKVVVLLSDGEDNTAWLNPADNQLYSVLGGSSWDTAHQNPVNTAALPLPADTKIYTVALGKDADIDKAALDHLANATGASYRAVDPTNADVIYQLMKYYTEIFMDVVDMASLSDPKFIIQPGATMKIPFDVLRGDVSGMVVIYDIEGIRLPFWLETPKGEIVDASSLPPGFQLRPGFTERSRFLQFKMPPLEPDRYGGTWNVVVQHNKMACRGNPQAKEGARLGYLPEECRPGYRNPVQFGIAIAVGSNFRMQPYVTPQKVYIGDPIWLDAVVSEAGLPVTGCAVSVDVLSPGGSQWQLTLSDDGAHNDGGPNDAEYAETFRFTSQPGTYDFLFRATGHSHAGEPVTREATRSKYVWPRDGSPGEPPKTDPCCEKLLRLQAEEIDLLKRLLKRKV
jgi:hypothetical protein